MPKAIKRSHPVKNSHPQTLIPTTKIGVFEHMTPVPEQIKKIKDDFQKAVQPVIDSLRDERQKSERKLDAQIFLSQSSTVRLDPIDRKLLERVRDQKVTETNTSVKNTLDLIYDGGENTLSRTTPEKVLTSQFKGGEAKRLQLFVHLLRTKKYVLTDDLRDELNCPTNEAVRKVVQGINSQIKKNLRLDVQVIQGRLGSGYRINPEVMIHKK